MNDKEHTPEDILKQVLEAASEATVDSQIKDEEIEGRLEYVVECKSNRAGIRLLMACLLAKIHRPGIDPRKPYTEIGGVDSFSGRSYDETYLSTFIYNNKLPANATTAFLTPTLRNIDHPLNTEAELVGRPRELYANTIGLLEDVAEGRVDARVLLEETIRRMIGLRDKNAAKMNELVANLDKSEDTLPLSSEEIINLIEQHLASKYASRLPVLIVAAAYQAASERLTERIRPLQAHNAADRQTGALGDVEVCLVGDDRVVTAYEMKLKSVLVDDINTAVKKIAGADIKIGNYIFITTDEIDPIVVEYARNLYDDLGTEIAILDCIGFLRHFLHLFHRIRIDYLDAYQQLVINEPDSAVNQSLKEAFLILRKVAERRE